MTIKAKKLLEEALQLPPEEREALAGQIYDSLEENDPATEAAWKEEIGRRIAKWDQGQVQPIPWAEAKQMIFGDADDAVQD